MDLLQSKQDSASCLLATGNPDGLLVSARPGSAPPATRQSWVRVEARLCVFLRSLLWRRGEESLICGDLEFLSPATDSR